VSFAMTTFAAAAVKMRVLNCCSSSHLRYSAAVRPRFRRCYRVNRRAIGIPPYAAFVTTPRMEKDATRMRTPRVEDARGQSEAWRASSVGHPGRACTARHG
jgi:hypothetical protein